MQSGDENGFVTVSFMHLDRAITTGAAASSYASLCDEAFGGMGGRGAGEGAKTEGGIGGGEETLYSVMGRVDEEHNERRRRELGWSKQKIAERRLEDRRVKEKRRADAAMARAAMEAQAARQGAADAHAVLQALRELKQERLLKRQQEERQEAAEL